MKKNVGSIDKVIRLVLALALFSCYFLFENEMKFIAAIGVIPLFTGALSFCPLYRIFGINSCKVKNLN